VLINMGRSLERDMVYSWINSKNGSILYYPASVLLNSL
jgi:hypothetical protein